MTDAQKIKSVVFFIEATSFEKFCLWEKYHKETNWVSEETGFSKIIGHINNHKNKPVNVSFLFVTIYGKCKDKSRRAMTDADNFHLVLSELNPK